MNEPPDTEAVPLAAGVPMASVNGPVPVGAGTGNTTGVPTVVEAVAVGATGISVRASVPLVATTPEPSTPLTVAVTSPLVEDDTDTGRVSPGKVPAGATGAAGV